MRVGIVVVPDAPVNVPGEFVSRLPQPVPEVLPAEARQCYLSLVEPRSPGRREVEAHAPLPRLEPLARVLRILRRAVVHDVVDLLRAAAGAKVPVEGVGELRAAVAVERLPEKVTVQLP